MDQALSGCFIFLLLFRFFFFSYLVLIPTLRSLEPFLFHFIDLETEAQRI